MDKKTKALMVIACNPAIRHFLKKNDPMALYQVEFALGKDKPTKKTHPQTFKLMPEEKAERKLDRIMKNPKAVDALNKQLSGMGIHL